MPVHNMGIETTLVGTSQAAPLGFRFTELASAQANTGEKEWVYVFNDDPTNAVAAGSITYRDPSAATQDMYGITVTPATTPQPGFTIVGVGQHACAVGSYCFIQARGKGLVQCGTADITADTRVTSGGSGVGDAVVVVISDTAATDTQHSVFAVSLEAETADNTTFDAALNCLGY